MFSERSYNRKFYEHLMTNRLGSNQHLQTCVTLRCKMQLWLNDALSSQRTPGMDIANSSAHFKSWSPMPASHAIHVTENICHYFHLIDHGL